MSTRDDALLVEEYRSLRAESAHAREAQQAILRWSMAAIGIVIAGILTNPPVGIEAMVLYGLVVPGFLAGATLAWFGELIRMERVGFYLRGRERITWPAVERVAESVSEDRLLAYPLAWENFIAFRSSQLGERKQLVGYLGTIGLLVGALLASLGMFVDKVLHYDLSNTPAIRLGLMAWAILVGVGLCALYIWLSMALQSVGVRKAPVPIPRLEK